MAPIPLPLPPMSFNVISSFKFITTPNSVHKGIKLIMQYVLHNCYIQELSTCALKFGARDRKNIASGFPDSCARVGLKQQIIQCSHLKFIPKIHREKIKLVLKLFPVAYALTLGGLVLCAFGSHMPSAPGPGTDYQRSSDHQNCSSLHSSASSRPTCLFQH